MNRGINSRELSDFVIKLRRVGDRLLLLQQEQEEDKEEGQQRFFPIGANGDGDEGAPQGLSEPEGTSVKRKREEKKEGGVGTEPYREPLQKRSKQDKVSLQDEVNRLVLPFRGLAPELIFPILGFALQPRFLPEYYIGADPRTWPPVDSSDYAPDSGKWFRTHPVVRQDEARTEIQRTLLLFTAISRTSTQMYELVHDPYLKNIMYRQWLESMRTEPAWLDFGKYTASIPIPGVRFRQEDTDEILATIGILEDEDDSTEPVKELGNIPKWFSIFLANVVVAWFLGQWYRSSWKLTTAMLQSDPSQDGRVRWDTEMVTFAQINLDLWPGIEMQRNVNNVRFSNFRFRVLHQTWSKGDRAYKVSVKFGDNSTPDKWRRQVAAYNEKWQPELWLRNGAMTKDTAFVKWSAPGETLRHQAKERFKTFMWRAMVAATVIRIPTLSAGRNTILGSFDVGLSEDSFQRGWNEITHVGPRPPVILWEPPLVWLDSAASALEPGVDAVFWPGFGGLWVRNAVVGNTRRTGQMLSLILNGHYDPGICEAIDFLEVYQSTRQDAAIMDIPPNWGADLPQARVLGDDPPPYRGLKPLELAMGHSFYSSDTVPDYLKPYKIELLEDLYEYEAEQEEEDDGDDN